MGKRYKAGNHGRKRKPRPSDKFFRNEKELNKLINKFMDYLFHRFDEDSFTCYEIMNKLRLEIKRKFDVQGKQLHHVGVKRRYVYYDQLGKFKFVYTHWKKKTYCIYIINRYDLPRHLLPFLKYLDSEFMKTYFHKKEY